jgi:hypothetical protein
MFGIPLLPSSAFTRNILKRDAAMEPWWLSTDRSFHVFRCLMLIVGILFQARGIPRQVGLWRRASVLENYCRWRSVGRIPEHAFVDSVLLLLRALTGDKRNPGEQGLLVVCGPLVWHIRSTYAIGVQVRTALAIWEVAQYGFQLGLVEGKC